MATKKITKKKAVEAEPIVSVPVVCPDCNGTGRDKPEETCPACQGTGKAS